MSLRDIRCDLFSVQSLASALRVRRNEIIHWIEQGWLDASIETRRKRSVYIITPEALSKLYKQHPPDLLKQGLRNQVLFEAYLQYCFSPKHTIGEQLLDVRRDKRERAAFAAVLSDGTAFEEDEGHAEDYEDREPTRADLEDLDEGAGD